MIAYFFNYGQKIRFLCLFIAWTGAISQVLFGDQLGQIVNLGALAYAGFIILTVVRLRRDSILILLMLTVVAWSLISQWPDQQDWAAGGRYILIFSAFLPTMVMVRATALTMPSVHRTQTALSKLPAEAASGGFQLAANMFGGVINLGALAILSAAVPANANLQRRKLGAEATLRGMVTAAAWSPFFVAFAVGQSFTDPLNSWIAIAIGSVTTVVFALITIPVFNRSFTLAQLRLAVGCLAPVLVRILVVLVAVLAAAIIFGFTALSAVVVVMPVLIIIQFALNPPMIPVIVQEGRRSIKSMADDIVIISVSMLIGHFAVSTDVFNELFSTMHTGMIPGWWALMITPLVMMVASLVGVHPVISSVALLSVFSNGNADVHPALLMQAHLIGWGAGTMSSVASLSAITCANLFNIPIRQIVLGPNLLAALGYAVLGGAVLSLVNLAL